MYLKNLIDIYDSEGRKLDMDALGLLGLKLQVPSPSYNTNSQEIDGRGGITVMGRVLQSRDLSAQFLTMADNYKDSIQLRDRLYRLLGNGKPFYVSENETPTKRWKVYFDEWTPERQSVNVHTFEIPLLNESGFSESINKISKVYNSSSFRFNNAGDLTIDPRMHPEIQIKFSGPSTNLKIKNTTTGDEWSWTGVTSSSDTVLLSGIRSLKNGTSIFGQTNKKLLTIDPGWNSFQLTGVTGSYSLSIVTRFYFL